MKLIFQKQMTLPITKAIPHNSELPETWCVNLKLFEDRGRLQVHIISNPDFILIYIHSYPNAMHCLSFYGFHSFALV